MLNVALVLRRSQNAQIFYFPNIVNLFEYPSHNINAGKMISELMAKSIFKKIGGFVTALLLEE